MINVLFVCAGGMSSSLIAQKLENVSKKNGAGFNIWARGVTKLKDEISKNSIDIVIVAPQIRYMLKQLLKLCEESNIKCVPIKPNLYVPTDQAIEELYKSILQELEK